MNLCFFYEFMCEIYVGFVGCRAADEVCFSTDPESTSVASACECGVAAQGDSFFGRVPLPLIVRFCC